MAVILVCDDCKSGYRLGQLRQFTDAHGSTTYQCPSCWAPVGQTSQEDDGTAGVDFGTPAPSV